MMSRPLVFLSGFSLLAFASIVSAQSAQPADAMPILPDRADWAGILLIVIAGGFFLPAAVIGPIVHALAPRDVPPAQSHDEPPGTSGHHGRSGTRDDSAPEQAS